MEHEHRSDYYTATRPLPYGKLRFVVHLLEDGYALISFSLYTSATTGPYTLFYGVRPSYSAMLDWESKCNRALHSDLCTENNITILPPNIRSEYEYIYRNSSSLGDVEHVYITARLDSLSTAAVWPVRVAVELITVTEDYLLPKNTTDCENTTGGDGGEGGGDGGGGGGDGGEGGGDGGGGGDSGGGGDGDGEVLGGEGAEMVCLVKGHDIIFNALTDSKRCVYIHIYGEDFLIHRTQVEYAGRIDIPVYVLMLSVMAILGGFVLYCCVRAARR